MWRALILAAGLVAVFACPCRADDEEEERKPEGRRRGQLSEDQKALRKEMLEKYDKNKDGKIDAEERKLISPQDMARLDRAGMGNYTPRRRRVEPPAPAPGRVIPIPSVPLTR